MKEDRSTGPVAALLSAALFGVSPVFAKILVGDTSPILLAGLLYLGSGISLLAGAPGAREGSFQKLKALSASHKLKLLGAIASGGIVAPLLLMFGLKYASAFETSVLLNLETVATTLIAYFVFHEHVSRRVWAGKVLLLVGAALILAVPGVRFTFSIPGLFVIGACVFWGLDNNLTRDVEDLSPSILAGTKGLCAGVFNIALAYLLGQSAIGAGSLIASLGLGALSYGLSLVLFVKALRVLGASRTSTYFATGPFWGMLLAVLLLGEHPPILHWIAAGLMGLGAFVLYRERHVHEHTHEEMKHRHQHIHDEHHQHFHDGSEGPEPHDHAHAHQSLIHSHGHLPDIHHRHRH
jgi:drug/metabolite transporter (DMT)-like permease